MSGTYWVGTRPNNPADEYKDWERRMREMERKAYAVRKEARDAVCENKANAEIERSIKIEKIERKQRETDAKRDIYFERIQKDQERLDWLQRAGQRHSERLCCKIKSTPMQFFE